MMRPLACAACYAAITAFLARDLLWNLGTAILGDQGDPLFVAAILHWNATTVPLTDAWWQFPIFDPTRDALAFSEHLLGTSPIATPLHWITRDAVVTYNVATLLTFPLCGLAMFALAHRLTRNAPAAFLAGLAFAFAPYRISHLPHLQVLAFFWAPLALLGLHAYIESGRRRWLVLYAAAWMLQGATNGYALVFLSVFVAFWVLWFVVARGNWPALAAISVATVVAALPLAPIVLKYLSVHALHGFKRDLAEMRVFSADLAALFCAPPRLTFWGWLRIACRPEGELFPGFAAAAGALLAWRTLPLDAEAPSWRSPLTVAGRLLIAAALAAAVVAFAVTALGPLAFQAGPVRVSASSIAKPLIVAAVALILAIVISPRIRAAAKHTSTPGFYVAAALLTWVLALGPTLTFMGEARGFEAPFSLLTSLPGVSGLRAPARFWLLTTMCLSTLVGFGAAALVERSRSTTRAGVVALGALLLLTDGWVARFPAAPVIDTTPDAAALRNRTVLTLPMDTIGDIAAQFKAVIGGWRSVNGYSGYSPGYYPALLDAAKEQDDGAVVPFVARGDLHILVPTGEPGLKRMVERQPGVVVTATRAETVQYRIPRRDAVPRGAPEGERLPIASVRGSCAESDVRHIIDSDDRTRWQCGPQRPGQELLVDLGRPVTVRSASQSLGVCPACYPRHLLLEVSTDGTSWEAVWNGSVRTLLIAQAIEAPGSVVRVTVPFAPRTARYIRLRQTAADPDVPWSVAELEIRSGR